MFKNVFIDLLIKITRMFLGSEFWIKMSRSDKFYEEYSKIQENSTYEYIPTKKMYDDIITFLTSGKADA